VALNDLVDGGAEIVVIDEGGEFAATGSTIAPQLMIGYRVTKLVPKSEQQLVGVVRSEIELISNLGRREMMAKLQIKQARISGTKCCRCGPHQTLLITSVIDGLGFEAPVRPQEVVAISLSSMLPFVDAGHDVTVEWLCSTLLLETVESTIPASSQQPAAKTLRIIELVQPLPCREEDVLGDLCGGVIVANDVPSNVVDPIEPPLEQLSESC